MKRIFAQRPSLNLQLLLALATSSALMLADHQASLGGVRGLLSTSLHPLQQVVHAPFLMTRKVWDAFSTYTSLVVENQRLKDERTFLNTRLLTFAALERENLRLRTLLDTAHRLGEQLLVAELLSVQMDPYRHVVIVNKGENAGLKKAQPALDEHGIVGQVLRTAPLSAEIILITDPNHAVPVQVVRNGLLTIAVGAGRNNQLLLPYLPNNADIRPDDALITSGLGGVFPAGYPVATVTAVTPQPSGPFALITARPIARLDRGRELLIAQNRDAPLHPTAPTPPGAPP